MNETEPMPQEPEIQQEPEQNPSDNHVSTFKAKCPKCGKVFEKSTQTKADGAVRMHMGRSHSRSITTYMGGRIPKHEREARAAKAEAKPEKRQYIKRNPPVAASVTINFCPKCGTDLHKIATAIVLGNKLGQ